MKNEWVLYEFCKAISLLLNSRDLGIIGICTKPGAKTVALVLRLVQAPRQTQLAITWTNFTRGGKLLKVQ